MYGKITIEVKNHEKGVEFQIRPELYDYSVLDKMALLQAFCAAMEISPELVRVTMMLKDAMFGDAQIMKVDVGSLNEAMKNRFGDEESKD